MPSMLSPLRAALGAAVLATSPLWLGACSSPPPAAESGTTIFGRVPDPGQQRFASAEEAVAALARAVKSDDRAALAAIFGPNMTKLESGVPEVDQAHLQRFAAALAERQEVVPVPGMIGVKSLLTGVDATPFPVPLVLHEGTWFFDTDAGVAELLVRRIGANELRTMEVCLALVAAQREYFAVDRDGDGVREYAAKLVSTPGQRDGLHWTAGDSMDQPSPIGPKLANAASAPGEPPREPYFGYVYRSLHRQGAGAPGGARSYVEAGEAGGATGGFAFIAYPAVYGQTGVMTFMVGPEGVLYEFDLGPDSAAMAEAVEVYDPTGWDRAVAPEAMVGSR
jgi:hypothetical protein